MPWRYTFSFKTYCMEYMFMIIKGKFIRQYKQKTADYSRKTNKFRMSSSTFES